MLRSVLFVASGLGPQTAALVGVLFPTRAMFEEARTTGP